MHCIASLVSNSSIKRGSQLKGCGSTRWTRLSVSAPVVARCELNHTSRLRGGGGVYAQGDASHRVKGKGTGRSDVRRTATPPHPTLPLPCFYLCRAQPCMRPVGLAQPLRDASTCVTGTRGPTPLPLLPSPPPPPPPSPLRSIPILTPPTPFLLRRPHGPLHPILLNCSVRYRLASLSSLRCSDQAPDHTNKHPDRIADRPRPPLA